MEGSFYPVVCAKDGMHMRNGPAARFCFELFWLQFMLDLIGGFILGARYVFAESKKKKRNVFIGISTVFICIWFVWYVISCTDTTSSAVELFAENEGFEIYFSQNPADHPNFQGYCESDINPRACDGDEDRGVAGSGLR